MNLHIMYGSLRWIGIERGLEEQVPEYNFNIRTFCHTGNDVIQLYIYINIYTI